MPAFQDLTGRRFGMLEVLMRMETRNSKTRWLCRCDCGNQKDIMAGSLLEGRSTNCGCRNLHDLTGMRFGRLVVTHRAENYRHLTKWYCKCDCHNTCSVLAMNLKKGTKSCGCLVAEMRGLTSRTHGMSHKIPEYGVWTGIKARTTNPNTHNYSSYGGRGIKVCKRWLASFESFLSDMGRRPSPEHTIERVNNDKDYSPSNCRWATKREQSLNKQGTRRVKFKGLERTVLEWSEITGIKYATLLYRVTSSKMTIDEALTKGLKGGGK